MMKHISDVEVIESVKKGNAADFSILVDRYKDKAFTMLKRILKNEFDAEEVLMDAFLKVYNNLNSFKFESKFSTWFYRIVYNSALTRLSISKRKIEEAMNSIDDLTFLESKYKADEFNDADVSNFVRKIIDDLPPKNAAVVTMFYLEEMNIEEISEVLEISVSNVKIILYRSRGILKNLIESRNLLGEIL